jgi:hypothetical protein
MAKTYFLAPTRDTPPSGPIFLGAIITSPRSPELSLNNKKSPLLTALEVSTSTLRDSTRTLSKGAKGKAGVWCEFVVDIGVGGNAGTTWDNTEVAEYKFGELVTKTIAPGLDEVRKLFSDDAVQQAIKDSRFGSNLYMITGVKIARGAEVAISKVKALGGNLHFGVDTTPFGVPLKVGPDLENERSKGQGLTEKHDYDFVFAYRLREIRYKRREVKEQKEYAKGDLMGHDQERNESDSDEEYEGGEPELVGMNGGDVKGDAWELDPSQAMDDDDEVVQVVRFENEEE